MVIRVKIFFAAFENRNGDVVPLHCQFERRNLRAHEKNFTGPRGRQKFQSKCDESEIKN